MRQPIQVLVYAVRRVGDHWEYLLLRRILSRGGFWQGVTGGVRQNEGLVEAARRELLEETGLVPALLERVDYSYSFPLDDEWRHLYSPDVKEIMEYIFVAHVGAQQEPRIDPREHDAWRWCCFKEALELLHWPENKEALKRCHEILTARSSL
uniref:Nucleotide phosphate derivative pyrophosphohydrolases, MutT/NUDIX family protein n=1 Tax=Acetithermum autotrophicum TaxID=1446466 RepID=H5SRZ1_ACEAU|nr:nucleotide phosphate derivative pyrophosphohydrolases, MutT/NUDIX family protein [Candidatus Acetothermum autotrophicum]